MKVKEIVRWVLVLLFGSIAASIISWGGSEMILSMLSQRWTDAAVTLFLTALFAAFPVIYAILAFKKRWRDLLVFPVQLAALIFWGCLMSLPRKFGLYELHNIPLGERPPWFTVVEVLLVPVILIGPYMAAKWFVNTAFRLLARIVPVNES